MIGNACVSPGDTTVVVVLWTVVVVDGSDVVVVVDDVDTEVVGSPVVARPDP